MVLHVIYGNYFLLRYVFFVEKSTIFNINLICCVLENFRAKFYFYGWLAIRKPLTEINFLTSRITAFLKKLENTN